MYTDCSTQTTDPSVAAWLNTLQVEAASATSWLSNHRTSDQPAKTAAPALSRDDPLRAFACMCDVRCCKGETDGGLDSTIATPAAPTASPPPRRGFAAAPLSMRASADGERRSGGGRRRGGGIYQSAASSTWQSQSVPSFVSPRTPAPSLLPVNQHPHAHPHCPTASFPRGRRMGGLQIAAACCF